MQLYEVYWRVLKIWFFIKKIEDRRGRDRMVVEFTTTRAINVYHL
jgi:hypothetical protein